MKKQYCQIPGFCKMENIIGFPAEYIRENGNSETSGIENAGRMLYNVSTM